MNSRLSNATRHSCRVLLVYAAMVAPAAAESVTLRTDDCKRLIQHVPAKDVEYKAGVDVHGKAVVPADLGGGYPNMVPEEVTIQIGVDLADRLARARAKRQGNTNPTTGNRPILGYEGKAAIGAVTVRGNDILWNGEPLAPQDEASLVAACRASKVAAEPPPPKPTPPRAPSAPQASKPSGAPMLIVPEPLAPPSFPQQNP